MKENSFTIRCMSFVLRLLITSLISKNWSYRMGILFQELGSRRKLKTWGLLPSRYIVLFFTLDESLSESMLRIYTCIKMLIGMSEMKEMNIINLCFIYLCISFRSTICFCKNWRDRYFFLDIYLIPNCMYRYNILIIIDVNLFRGSGWLSELGSWIT